MSEGTILLLAAVSTILSALAVGISLIVLRRILKIEMETSRLAGLLYFRELESKQRGLAQRVELSDRSLKGLTDGTRMLGSDVSRTFADIAQLLNETHRLEGNPRPHIDNRKLHEINEKLLSAGESSLSATRRIEKLSVEAAELRSRLESLRKEMSGED
jgi:hypothetical protein